MFRLKSKIKIHLILLLAMFALIFQNSCYAKAANQLRPEQQTWQPLLITVNVNQQPLPGIYQAYLDKDQKIWIDKQQVSHLGLPATSNKPVTLASEEYYQLDWYPELHYVYDQYAQAVTLSVPPSWLPVNNIESPQATSNKKLRPEQPGVFVNYDVTNQHNSFANDSYVSGITELGYFNHYGVGTSNFLLSNQKNSQSDSITRLETTWTLDQPEHMATWRLGDSITSATDWSGAVRFGGIQYATNFSTQPNLVTFPLPTFRGEAVVPSTVDVFVNSTLRTQQSVNSGPFYVNDVPVVTGAGNMQVVTTDMLGRQQVSVLPYYASEQLLKPGLSDYSFEVGAVRENYGINSNDYGRMVGVGTYTRGLSDNDTAGIHVEALSQQQTLGLSNYYLLKNFAVITLAGSASHSDLGEGGLLELGVQRQSSALSFGARTTLASDNYKQLGIFEDDRAPALTSQAFIGYSSEDQGSLSLSYTAIKNRTPAEANDENISATPSSKLLTVNYNRTFLRQLHVLVGAVRDFENHDNDQVFATLVWALDNSTSVSANTQSQKDHNQQSLIVNKNLPLGDGFGYRLIAQSNDVNRYEGDLAWQNPYSTLSGKYANVDGTHNYELNAQGSIIHFADNTFLARSVDDSFALVEVPEHKDVKVYYRNQLIGKTNDKGNLYVPRLLSYQINDLKIDATDLPLNTQITTTDKKVIPYFRSGVLVKFPAVDMLNLTATLKQDQGDVVPAGAEVFIEGSSTSYPVGYEGKVFIYDLPKNKIDGTVSWSNKRCQFSINIPEQQANLVQAGEVLCHPVKQINHG